MYLDEFKSAIERTRKFNLELPLVSFDDKEHLTPSACEGIPALLLDKIGIIDFSKVFAQCFAYHHLTQQIFEEYFKTKITYTIGWVYEQPNNLYKQSEEQLFELLKHGPKSSELNLHTWLTLPSMEIIDLTLPTTVAIVRNRIEDAGGLILGHPDQFTGGLSYHPMLVGDDFFRKIGFLVEIPFSQFV